MSEVVAFVLCRGGSKGVPGKNLRELGGRTLVARAIDAARGARQVTRVVVSTDDQGIADEARRAGADVPFLRPSELAGDETPELLAWRHALDAVEAAGTAVSLFVSVPATAPLRAVDDVERCIEAALADPACDMAVTVTPSARNPWFDMIRIEDGRLRRAIDGPVIHRRQDAPTVYAVTPVCYAARPAWVRTTGGVLDGVLVPVVVPAERAVDIDSELDLRFAAFLLDQGA